MWPRAPCSRVQAGGAERRIEVVASEDARSLPEIDRGGIVARCAVTRGRTLAPGIQKTPYYWRDVVHGPPPRRRERGDCTHITFHGSDDSGDVRLSFGTLVRVDPGMSKDSALDDIIHVEERLYVQRRLLQEFIDRERNFTDKVALRMRSRLAHSMVKQRRYANRVEQAWMASALIGWIRFQARAGNASIRGFRAFMRGLVALPDAILTQTERASVHLASKSGRRWLKRAIRDPTAATPQEKAGVLVWLAFATTAWVLVIAALFATVLSRWDAFFQAELGDFFLALGNAVGVPLPPSETAYVARLIEMAEIFGRLAPAILIAAVGVMAGKILGSWMLYLMGDSLFDGLNKKSGPKLKRALHALQRSATKRGFLYVTIISAIPAAPDPLIIPFAVSGMKFRSYMWAIAFGTILKFAILAGLIVWIGADRVGAFMEHPFRTMGIGA